MMKQALALILSSAIAFSQAAYSADNSTANPSGSASSATTSVEKTSPMKIVIKVGDRALTATLIDNETARDFASLLPLTLTMSDLFGREKAGGLPRPISEGGERVRTYEVGELAYWSPGADLAIYYHHDGASIPPPGIIVIGKIDSGVEALNVPGMVTVTVTITPIER